MDRLLPWLGALVVALASIDVFFTVLFPASGYGPVRKPLYRLVWGGFSAVGRRLSGQRRRNLLSYAGPVLVVATIAAWFALLTLGWAMIYKPGLGSGITNSSGPTDTGWASALYVSGYNLTTLGVGGVTPATGVYRLLTVGQAALGFAFFGVSTTYALSIYSTLPSRNAFALGLHHFSACTDDAAELIARLLADGEASGARERLASTAAQLRLLHQTLHLYPALTYFHSRKPAHALPRVLLTVLDTVSLLRSTLDPLRHGGLPRSLALDELWRAALLVLELQQPGACEPRPPSAEQARAWRARHAAALERFAAQGLALRADAAQAGAGHYVELRSRWQSALDGLAATMLHAWEGATDCETRAEERVPRA